MDDWKRVADTALFPKTKNGNYRVTRFAFFAGEFPAQAADCQKDQAGDERNRNGRDNVRGQMVQILGSLGEILHQLRPVVGQDDDRQTFDRFLQTQLQACALVHLGEQFLILALEFDVDAGAQQLAVAGDAGGEFFLAAADRRAGIHCGQQTALHEFAEGWQAGNAGLAQFLDALHDQSVIGPRRAEAKGRTRDRVFDFGCQRRKRGQCLAFVLGRPRLADLIHQHSELLLAPVQPAADRFCHRQAEQ